MSPSRQQTRFKTKLLHPEKPDGDASWAFVVLPKESSEILPRRGRTSVKGTMNGHPFTSTLDPDGQLSHWLKIDERLQKAAGIQPGISFVIEIAPVEQEPEPEIPPDFEQALASFPEARKVWRDTTTLARVDWIHWMTSARQAKTRAKRVKDACEMLTAGKKRVCCFDPSGYYSKAFSAPKAAKEP